MYVSVYYISTMNVDVDKFSGNAVGRCSPLFGTKDVDAACMIEVLDCCAIVLGGTGPCEDAGNDEIL